MSATLARVSASRMTVVILSGSQIDVSVGEPIVLPELATGRDTILCTTRKAIDDLDKLEEAKFIHFYPGRDSEEHDEIVWGLRQLGVSERTLYYATKRDDVPMNYDWGESGTTDLIWVEFCDRAVKTRLDNSVKQRLRQLGRSSLALYVNP